MAIPATISLEYQKFRPTVYYDESDTVRRHYQKEQEELFYIVSGHAVMEIDGEEFEIEADDFVVDPGSMRQIHSLENTEILAVGAPNRRDDAVFENDEQ